MNRDDFQWLVVSLLLVNLAAVYLVGEVLWRELQRPSRIIRIYEGGRPPRDTDNAA